MPGNRSLTEHLKWSGATPACFDDEDALCHLTLVVLQPCSVEPLLGLFRTMFCCSGSLSIVLTRPSRGRCGSKSSSSTFLGLMAAFGESHSGCFIYS